MRGWVIDAAGWPTVRNSSWTGSSASAPSASSIQAPAPAKAALSAVKRAVVLAPRPAPSATRSGSSSQRRGAGSSTRTPGGRLCTWLSSGDDMAVDEDQPPGLGAAGRCGADRRSSARSTRGASAIGTFAALATLVYFQASARVVGMPSSPNRAKERLRASRPAARRAAGPARARERGAEGRHRLDARVGATAMAQAPPRRRRAGRRARADTPA